MDISIKKFLDEIQKVSDNIVSSSIGLYYFPNDSEKSTDELHKNELKMREISNLSKALTIHRNYPENHGEVFADFDILCEYLDNTELNYRDVYNILMFFIIKNIHSGILNTQSILVDLKSIDSSGYSEETIDFVKYLMVQDKLNEFVNKGSFIVDLEIDAFNLLQSFIIDMEPYKSLTRKIKECYIDKKGNLDAKDIKAIEEYLIQVKVSAKSRACFMKVVNKDYQRQVSKNEVKITPSIYKIEKDENKRSIQNYKKTEKEIREIYNPTKGTLLTDISYNEMISLAKKMRSIGYSDYELVKLFKVALDYDRVIELGDYCEYYEKYKHYISSDRIDMIEAYLAEMVICNDEDYLFWKEQVISLLKSCSDSFKYKVDYELKLVNGLIK